MFQKGFELAEACITGSNVTDEAYRQWLYVGLSVRDAARIAGIGPSTLQDKIRKERSKNPDLDELRELQNTLRSNNSSVAAALRCTRWKDRIDDQNISTRDLEKVVPIIEKLGDNPLEKIRDGEKPLGRRGRRFRVHRIV